MDRRGFFGALAAAAAVPFVPLEALLPGRPLFGGWYEIAGMSDMQWMAEYGDHAADALRAATIYARRWGRG